MALAGLGHERGADNPWPERLQTILATDDGAYEVDPTFTRFGTHSYAERFTDKLADFITGFDSRLRPLGSMNRGDQARLLDPAYVDLAWGVQRRLEEAVGEILSGALSGLATRNLCIAGGVGLNCKMNGSLLLPPRGKVDGPRRPWARARRGQSLARTATDDPRDR